MADTLTDALRVERTIRGFVAIGLGLAHQGDRAHERVARTAVLGRLGLSVPDIEELEVLVAETYGVTLIIHMDSTPAAIADQIITGLARRAVAHV
ncbi:hypothetical protein HL658_09885 [Azospirillum sp. RWY-5-1]|uniref:Acyl carrier protein n=1 Tax=Azospirillum oleiclasticum TaxID=2735135 RepID=A0ABX2T7I0_9PROT|nr:hypothetical protein [Azospirillum oleiclasticum]NYZ12862.1 hypothetical protein [Azospirillum oleiclasticum]NYZ20022.1 hypothetical protein [Azospirillum oleiclasticum]